MRPVNDGPGAQEQPVLDDRMAEHMQQRTGHGDGVHQEKPEQDIAHLADGRIGQPLLQDCFPQRHGRTHEYSQQGCAQQRCLNPGAAQEC